MRRDNVTNNDNGTVSSIPVYTYVFDRERSIGPETDTFLGINMPMTVSTRGGSITYISLSDNIILDFQGSFAQKLMYQIVSAVRITHQ